jgi:hypothetical protein
MTSRKRERNKTWRYHWIAWAATSLVGSKRLRVNRDH